MNDKTRRIKRSIMGVIAALAITLGVSTVTTSPVVSAHSYCKVDWGSSGSTGSWARVQDTSSNNCWEIIRAVVYCWNGGQVTVYGPWRGINVKSYAYCPSGYTRQGYSYQTQYVNH